MTIKERFKSLLLPDFCFSFNQVTGETILIKKFEAGYYEVNTPYTAEELNHTLGVNKAQVLAMEVGSMFGWNIPGANPITYKHLLQDSADNQEISVVISLEQWQKGRG